VNFWISMKFFRDDFDSRIFNKEVYKLFLEKESQIDLSYEKNIANKKIDIIFAFSAYSTENINFFYRHNFRFINTRNIYECKDLSFSPVDVRNYSIVEAGDNVRVDETEADTILKNIAETSRYFKDTCIKKEIALILYQEWLKNSLEGYAEKVFLLYLGKFLIGFITLKGERNKLFIDLIGIDEKFISKGLGGLLINRAKDFCLKQNKELWVITEGENVAANRFYQKNGFLVKEFRLVFHKHYK